MTESDRILTGQIENYIVENGINKSSPNHYSDLAKEFGVNKDRIRNAHMRLVKRGLLENYIDLGTNPTGENGGRSFSEDLKTGNANVIVLTKKRIKTLDDLIIACEIDTDEWDIVSYECNKWEVGRKNKNLDISWNAGVMTGAVHDKGNLFVEPLFQVKVKLARKKLGTDLVKQKDFVIKELTTHFKKYPYKVIPENTKVKTANCVYEISLFDHHFGKLSWKDETGENYDLKIALERWESAIDFLLNCVNLNRVEKFFLPIGNDLFHSDNKENSTTAGTLLDSDVRYFKMVKLVKRVLLETINRLLAIAPVDIVIVPGNHDYHSCLWMGEVLDSFYKTNPYVNIDIEPKGRKYYQYGVTGIQLTHGNEENHRELGLIFASEAKKIWYDTEFHFCQTGHYHKKKKTEHVSTDEYQGFEVEILPSLSGSDAWHAKKGYHAGKAAKSYLFDKNIGKVGEFFFPYVTAQ